MRRRDCVEVDCAKSSFRTGQWVGDPLADGAQVVAQVQVAGRLHTRQDALPHRRLAIGATTGAVVRATALPAVADDMVSGGSGIGYE